MKESNNNLNIYIYIYIYINISTMFAITKWSQDQCTKNNVSKLKRKEKIQKVLTASLINTPPVTKIPYANPPPMSDYSHIKTAPPFCHEYQRVSTSSRHLIITGRASTITLISIITTRAIVTLILRSWWR